MISTKNVVYIYVYENGKFIVYYFNMHLFSMFKTTCCFFLCILNESNSFFFLIPTTSSIESSLRSVGTHLFK